MCIDMYWYVLIFRRGGALPLPYAVIAQPVLTLVVAIRYFNKPCQCSENSIIDFLYPVFLLHCRENHSIMKMADIDSSEFVEGK